MSLDSLMDALTNVVGILVVILIFAVIGGQEAVKRIRGFVDEITDEQLADKAAESEELRKLVEAQRASWEELDARAPEHKLTIEEQQRLLEQLKADIAQLSGTQIDPDELKKQLEERKQRAAELEAKIAEQEKLLASLKARLAENPAQGAMADTKVVNLPDPRPAPEGAQKVTVLCRGGRLYPVDEKGLQQEAQQVLVGARRALEKEGKIDCEKLADLFEKRFVGNRLFKLGVRQGGDGKPQLLLQPRDEAGEETEAVSKRTSLFNQALRQLNPAKQYIEFRVWSDSFDTYLAARNEAARAGILAGWTPYTETSEYVIGFGIDFNTTCAGYTPPPPRPSTPPDPNKPPPPPDVVD